MLLVSGLVLCLVSIIQKYQYTSVTLLHGDRETHVPAYITLPTDQRYLRLYEQYYRCTLKTTVCTVTAATIAGRATQESRYKVPSVVKHRQSPIMRPLLQLVTMARPDRQ